MSSYEVAQSKNKRCGGSVGLTKRGSLDANDAEKLDEKDKKSLNSPDYSQDDSIHQDIVSVNI